jgi:hypothetical protein
MGDFNIILLNHHSHTPTNEFQDINFANSFIPIINRPSRVTCKSATLIDNIFTNNIDNNHYLNGIFYTDISDHYPIFLIEKKFSKSSEVLIQYRRITSKQNMMKFTTSLNAVDWNEVTDTKTAFTIFHFKLLSNL